MAKPGESLRPEGYNGYWVMFNKHIFGNGVTATAYKGGKPAASAGGGNKEEAFSKIKMMLADRERKHYW